MNTATKKLLSYPRYNKNYPPCKLDICTCLLTYNLHSSYTNRFMYKKCYDKVERFFSNSRKNVERLFDGEA